MKVKKIISRIGLFFILLGCSFVFVQAQDNNQQATGDNKEGGETILSKKGLESIRNVLLDDFEDADSWVGEMPRDWGLIFVQRRDGGPDEIKKVDPEKNKYSLGARVNFFKTGSAVFGIKPPRELDVPGITKSISIWVAGRNYSHILYTIVKDLTGRLHKIRMGRKLNFPGWNRLTGQVGESIIQNDPRFVSKKGKQRGLYVISMYVECAMEETVGQYYLYLDQLEAQTDMFLEDARNKDVDDMLDNW